MTHELPGPVSFLCNMKMILCRFAVLMMAAGAWAATRTDGIVARIAFVSDTHVNLQTNESGIAYNRRFGQAMAAINAAKVDLVLIGGDLTDGGTREQMALFRRKAKEFKAPVLFVPGNHDVGLVGNGNVKTSITPERVELFSKELGPNWFACEKAGVRIVGINSCLFGSGFKEEADQWAFLEKALAKPHAKPTLLLEHHPLFIQAVDEARSGLRNVQEEQRQRLLVLAKQARARAFLSGHLHYPITNRLDGILFLGNATTAFGLPRGKQPEGWMLLSVPREGEVRFEFRELESDIFSKTGNTK
jgi:3',5'-cyclic AMP phosphodiesterase CpdA